MKKLFLYVAALTSCAAAFMSCEPNTQKTDTTKVWPAANSEGKVGYINAEGKFVVSPLYDEATIFSSGLGLVTKVGTDEKSTMSFVNSTGDTKITLGTDAGAFPFCEDRAIAQMAAGGNVGAMDPSGKWSVAATYEAGNLDNFSDGLAIFANSDNKYGAIDKSGKVVVPAQWDCLGTYCCGLARYHTGTKADKYGYIDKKGKIVIDAASTTYDYAAFFSEDLAAFVSGTKCGYIDKAGKVAIQPLYDACHGFSQGLAAVEQNDKWGFIDKKGTMKIAAVYDDVSDFWEDLAFVLSGKTYSVIDKSGNVKISLGEYVPFMDWFHNGLTLVGKYDKTAKKMEYKYINTKGETIYSVLIADEIDLAPEKVFGEKEQIREPLQHIYSWGKTIEVR